MVVVVVVVMMIMIVLMDGFGKEKAGGKKKNVSFLAY